MNILDNKKNEILNYLLFFGTILFIIMRIIFSSGGISSDSIEYFLQAKNFWHYKTNFSLGYPFLIKIFSLLAGGEFMASKIINIFSYIGIIIFSYSKKFFFPQTLLFFSFYTFLPLYSISLSEPLYFLLNYIIIYNIYKLILEGYSLKRNIVIGTLFFVLVSVRFAGVFVFISSIAFLGYFTLINKYSAKSFVYTFLLTITGVSLYLVINYFYCGFIFGNRNHLHIKQDSFAIFISEMLFSSLRDFSFLNVIIHKGILNRISFLNVWISLLIIVITIVTIIKKNLNYFDIYLLLSFLIIFIGILYSYYTTKIDDSARIKSSAYLYLILFLSFNIKKKYINYFKVFVILILCFNSLTLIKNYENIIKSPKKFTNLIDKPNTKNINIVYKDYNNERVNSKILLFKAFLIEKGYKIIESKNTIKYKKASDCYIQTNDIINL